MANSNHGKIVLDRNEWPNLVRSAARGPVGKFSEGGILAPPSAIATVERYELLRCPYLSASLDESSPLRSRAPCCVYRRSRGDFVSAMVARRARAVFSNECRGD